MATDHAGRWLDRLVALRTAGAGDVPPATMDVLRQDWEPLGRGVSCVGTPLRIGDRSFEHGLGGHATSHLVIRSGTPMARLRGCVGVDQNPRGGPGLGSVVFTVADVVERRWRSPVLRGGDPALRFEVEVPGRREVHLRIDDAGDSPALDHGDWAEAELVLADGRVLRLQDLPPTPSPAEIDLPFSFLYGGRDSRTLLSRWPHERRTTETAGRQTATTVWSDPSSGLRVTWETVRYLDLPAAESLVSLENTSTAPTGLVTELLALDTALRAPREGESFVLHSLNGAPADETDYEPRRTEVGGDGRAVLGGAGGRSSQRDFPFFHVETGAGVLVVAVGWSGQWQATLESPDREVLHLRAGLEQARFRLSPGERVRLPRMLLLLNEGDPDETFCLWRQLLRNHYTARREGRQPAPVLFCNTCFTRGGGWLNECNAENQVALIRALQPLGLEAVITDAGWFEGGWPEGAGNWTPRPDAYPEGLGPVAAAAKSAGMSYGLWFEPERVVAGTQVHREHPEWCLKSRPDDEATMLLDFGRPAARDWFFQIIAGFLALPGFRVYRQDCNLDPLPYWRANDAVDRVGLTEMHYVEGLYAYWDRIAATWPDSLREECASGGRRIDLETLRHLHLHQKSDYWFDSEVDQATLAVLNQYLPTECVSVPVNRLDDYSFHSALASSLICGWVADAPDFDLAQAARLVEQYRAVRHLFLGGYYPLLPYARDRQRWVAMQFHRADLDEGLVLVFRRPDSAYRAAELALRGVAPETVYELSRGGGEAPVRCPGEALRAGWEVVLPVRRGSLLMRYRRAE